MQEGIVVKNVNGYFYVQTEEQQIHECKVRGRLKKDRYSLLVGDKVNISKDGWIEEIKERRNSLRRPYVANLDQVILVVAAHNPDINLLLLNRLIVMIEHEDIPLVLCINKCDLGDEETDQLIEIYEKIGYPVIGTSTVTGEGIEELRTYLHGKVSAFAGPSGVGKSSLLNAIDANFQFQTGEVSAKIKRGKHTTRHASLYSLDEISFIMDTPGFSAIDHSHITLSRLPSLFPEFMAYEENCKFSPCSHTHEPVCGVKAALEEGLIHRTRYDAYTTLKQEIEEQRKR